MLPEASGFNKPEPRECSGSVYLVCRSLSSTQPSQCCCRWVEPSLCPSQCLWERMVTRPKLLPGWPSHHPPPGLEQRDVCICTLPPLKEPHRQLSALETATRLQALRAISSCGGRRHSLTQITPDSSAEHVSVSARCQPSNGWQD